MNVVFLKKSVRGYHFIEICSIMKTIKKICVFAAQTVSKQKDRAFGFGKGMELMKKSKTIIILLSIMVCTLICAFESTNKIRSRAESFSNGGCVAWVKYRAGLDGITLPPTGMNKYGVYGANNYWYTLDYPHGSEPQAGALAVWEFASGEWANYGHVAYVESVNGSTVTFTEGGQPDSVTYGGHTGVIQRVMDKNSIPNLGGLSGFLGYIYLKGDPVPPTASRRIYVDSITSNNAVLHWDLDDTPYMGTVGIWIAKENEEYAGKWVEFAPYSKTNKVSVDVNAECGRSLERGTKYKYKFYYYVGSDCTWSDEGTFVTQGDGTNPVITDAEVIHLDSNGYTVRCRATDDVGIDRVQCPTWTDKNGQDDLANNWETNTSVKATPIGDNMYEFVVKRSDHNNEYGLYSTHIYAFDLSGNSVCVWLSRNNVQEEQISVLQQGDVNSDGQVNASDVILLRRYIAGGYGVSVDEDAADVNADGVLNAADVILIRRYIAGGYGVELKGVAN